MPVAIMFPLMTIEHYLGGKWEMGLVEVIWGVGMLLGGGALGLFKLRSSKVVLINAMSLLMGLTFIVSGILSPRQFLGFVVATGIGGIAMAIFAACFNTFIISGILVMLTGLLSFGTPALMRLGQHPVQAGPDLN